MVELFVFVFRMKGLLKFGNVSIGVFVNVNFNLLNVIWYLFVYLNLIFLFVNLCRGFVIKLKFFINFW